MVFPRFGGNGTGLTALFDIRSESVGAALIESGEKPVARFTVRAPLPLLPEVTPEGLERSMLAALLSVALKTEEAARRKSDGPQRVLSVACVFSSPWYDAKTIVARLKQDASFTVTEKLFERALKEAETSFKKRVPASAVLLERNIIEASVNGYPTTAPVGKRGRSLDVALYLSALSHSVARKAREAIEKVFPGRPITLHSFGLAAFSALRDLFHEDRHVLLVDVSGEVTEISLVRDGVLLESASLPSGCAALTRAIAKASPPKTIDESASILSLFLSGKLDAEHARPVAEVLGAAGKEWVSRLGDLLSGLSQGMLLPATVFLTVPEGFAPWFNERLSDPAFGALTLTQAPFAVTLIDAPLAARSFSFASGAADPFLALEGIFLKKRASASP